MANVVDTLMNEHVPMLGFPQLIVTRGFCYAWLRDHGWDRQARGYASLDYAAFGRKAVAEPLTDEETRDRLLGLLESTQPTTTEG